MITIYYYALSSDLSTAISGKAASNHNHNGVYAPVSHASTGTGYGVGNANNYGHVKLSDTYTSNVGGASSSIAASQSALYNFWSVYSKLEEVNLISKLNSSIFETNEWSTLKYIKWGKVVTICVHSIRLKPNINVDSMSHIFISNLPYASKEVNGSWLFDVDDLNHTPKYNLIYSISGTSMTDRYGGTTPNVYLVCYDFNVTYICN